MISLAKISRGHFCVILFIISSKFTNGSHILRKLGRASSYPSNDTVFNAKLFRYDNSSALHNHIIHIRKCCDNNYFLNGELCIHNVNNSDFNDLLEESGLLPSTSNIVRYLSGSLKCPNNEHYVLNSLEFLLHEDGRLKENGVDELLNYDEFCVDMLNGKLSALVCFPEEHIQRVDFINTIGMLVSVPFLLATFVIYAVLPGRKLHGNALMCYVISLLGGFVLLAVLRLKKYGFSEVSCMCVAVPCVFFFLASFFWMNVMSIDIWWTFSGLGGFKGNRKDSEYKRFLIYSIYGWGAPFLVAIIIVSLSLSPIIPSDAWYNPGVGHGTACWFRQSLQELIYFYGPLAFLTIANVTLFAVTAYKIRRAQKDTAVLRKSDSQKHGDDDAQRFSLYLKLLLVMGLNWSMEIISYVVDWQIGEVPPAVWYITDFCNALYGVLIFFLFCFNKKTWNLLKARFNCGNRSETSGLSTQSTVAESRPLNRA